MSASCSLRNKSDYSSNLHEYLNVSLKKEDEVVRGFLHNIVTGESMIVFQLLPGEGQFLLVGGGGKFRPCLESLL